ncbi:MAG: tRNA 2-thiouridine(34) synthase MnmA [Magnetococcales bacterium]|nr:tRNA 2-thiouridine(34) synthase MnmA [Magnetococcales bacterium]
MSGGVDSSVAAAVLQQQGFQVFGLTMHLWDQPPACGTSRSCCTPEDAYDARRVAQVLDIPFYVIDFSGLFRRSVVQPFIDDYARGRTPNPCVRCNETLKFDILLNRAGDLGADFLATGHYVRLEESAGGLQLLRARDRRKDQSYFLFSIPRGQLPFLKFPLGGMTKAETRAVAARLALPVAEKSESQDCCFVPDGNYPAFFAKEAPGQLTPGDIVDAEGRLVGRHAGIALYTIGQRKGLGIASSRPLYVSAIDAVNNRLVVGPEEALYRQELELERVNWLLEEVPVTPLEISARIRYGGEAEPARLALGPDRTATVSFREPQRAITPGQACVFYREDRILGGGWIV